jgi:hypothetical protein
MILRIEVWFHTNDSYVRNLFLQSQKPQLCF